MNITTQPILNKWTEYTLTNNSGMCVSFLNYGGIITKIMSPDREGKLENVVLGYQHYSDYEQNPNYFGAIIGRVAGRISNASFHLNGKKYHLDANEEPHHLHGGANGFHQHIWEASPFQTENHVGVTLSLSSPDGAGGYPGQIDVQVTYTLTDSNDFLIDYEAISNKKTVFTLTNHTYFNLTGQLRETVRNHIVAINSDQFVEVDQELIPTGRLVDVADTTFDFRNGKKLSEGFVSTYSQNRNVGSGYDHYFLFNPNEEASIVVKEDTSGRILKMKTNHPGVVMYTGNGIDDKFVLRERMSRKHLGVCFETQEPPASLHHKGFPSITLEADERYQKQTVFSFRCE